MGDSLVVYISGVSYWLVCGYGMGILGSYNMNDKNEIPRSDYAIFSFIC